MHVILISLLQSCVVDSVMFLQFLLQDFEYPDDPTCWPGDKGDPVNCPDRYVFPNGDEVHMCAGEWVTRQELKLQI